MRARGAFGVTAKGHSGKKSNPGVIQEVTEIGTVSPPLVPGVPARTGDVGALAAGLCHATLCHATFLSAS